MKFFRKVIPASLKGLIAAVAVGAIGLTCEAWADPINFLPAGIDFKFKFSNEEVQITASGQELFGIFDINLITNSSASTGFWSGNGLSDGTQLVGFFTGLISVVPGPGGPSSVDFTGGSFVVYDVPNGDYNTVVDQNLDPAVLANRQAQLCGGVACPAPWVTGAFAPGILDAMGNMTITLDATLAPVSPIIATGTGYLSVGSNAFGTGLHDSFFDTNGYTFLNNPPADMLMKSEFSLCLSLTTPGCSVADWQVRSDDPILASSAPVPEPGSLVLVGLGMFAAAGIRRRRSSKSI